MAIFKITTYFYLQKIRFDRTMSLSKSNKLPQERNSYLISFPRYSEPFKVRFSPSSTIYWCNIGPIYSQCL